MAPGFWQQTGEIPPLEAALAREVLERIEVRPESPNLEALDRLYDAWSRRLGMENLSKRLRLLTADDPLDVAAPPEAGFESFLEHGTSGTCWPTMEMFVALAQALGFDARPRTGEMTDPGVANHGTVVVVLDGISYSVDQNLLWPHPLPLDRRQKTSVSGPHYDVEASYDPERGVFHIRPSNRHHELRPTVLIDREVSRGDYFPNWQRSLPSSIFNRGYFVHRRTGGVWRNLNTTEFLEIADGDEPMRRSTPPGRDRPAELSAFVERKLGINATLVRRLLSLENVARA